MRWLARIALAALGSVVSVVIACAYGTPWRYVKAGRVQDASTDLPIAGIRVGCFLGGGLAAVDLSDAEGRFRLEIESRCDEVGFTDVDGAENGTYLPASRAFTEGDELDLVVPLERGPAT